jgi:MtN3 and saliva related transmembrane protein
MVDVIGYLAGFLAMVSFLPQLVKTIRTKSAKDPSLAMLLLTLATNVLYLV